MSSKARTVQELHAETASIRWQELEVHFARGVVIGVASELDLVEVAVGFANDDKQAVERWITAGQVEHLGMETARDWSERDPELWAVVVAPWVVVQERVS
jgi:hypothetical protein